MKKAGIIGSGPVAQALAKGLLASGYNVKLGTRDTTKLTEWRAKAGDTASIGTFSEAAAHGDILILAVKGTAAADALHAAGTQHLFGKTIIDTTNPIADAPPVDGVLQFFTGPNDSLLERLQSQFPDANLVKAFNSVGNGAMFNPSFPGGQPTMFICGNNEGARKEVTDLLTTFGWEVSDMGKAAAARAIEPLCILWCIPGFVSNDWNHAFKLLRG